MLMNFKDFDGSHNSDIEKGESLLKALQKSDLESSIQLMTADGSVEGALYIIYKKLSQSGHIQNITTVAGDDGVVMSTSLLKHVMYNCFIIGAEAGKSVKGLEALWNMPDAHEPEGDKSNGEETETA